MPRKVKDTRQADPIGVLGAWFKSFSKPVGGKLPKGVAGPTVSKRQGKALTRRHARRIMAPSSFEGGRGKRKAGISPALKRAVAKYPGGRTGYVAAAVKAPLPKIKRPTGAAFKAAIGPLPTTTLPQQLTAVNRAAQKREAGIARRAKAHAAYITEQKRKGHYQYKPGAGGRGGEYKPSKGLTKQPSYKQRFGKHKDTYEREAFKQITPLKMAGKAKGATWTPTLPKQTGVERAIVKGSTGAAKLGLEFITDPTGAGQVRRYQAEQARRGHKPFIPDDVLKGVEIAALVAPGIGAAGKLGLAGKALRAAKSSATARRVGVAKRVVQAGTKGAKQGTRARGIKLGEQVVRVKGAKGAALAAGRGAAGELRALKARRAVAKQAKQKAFKEKGVAGKAFDVAMRKPVRYTAGAAGGGTYLVATEGPGKAGKDVAATVEGLARAATHPETPLNFVRTTASALGGLATGVAALGETAYKLGTGEAPSKAVQPVVREGNKFIDSTKYMLKEYLSGDAKRVEKVATETGLAPVIAMGLGATAGVRAVRRRGGAPPRKTSRGPLLGDVAGRYTARTVARAGHGESLLQHVSEAKAVRKAMKPLSQAEGGVVLYAAQHGISGERLRKSATHKPTRQALIHDLEKERARVMGAREKAGIPSPPETVELASVGGALKEIRGIQHKPQISEEAVISEMLYDLKENGGRRLADDKVVHAVDTYKLAARGLSRQEAFDSERLFQLETGSFAEKFNIPTVRQRVLNIRTQAGASRRGLAAAAKRERVLQRQIHRDIAAAKAEKRITERLESLRELKDTLAKAPLEVTESAKTKQLLRTVVKSNSDIHSVRAAVLFLRVLAQRLTAQSQARFIVPKRSPVRKQMGRWAREEAQATTRGGKARVQIPWSRRMDRKNAQAQRSKQLAALDRQIARNEGRVSELAPSGGKRVREPVDVRIRNLEESLLQSRAESAAALARAADLRAVEGGRVPPSVIKDALARAREDAGAELPPGVKQRVVADTKRVYEADMKDRLNRGYRKDTESVMAEQHVSAEEFAYVKNRAVEEGARRGGKEPPADIWYEEGGGLRSPVRLEGLPKAHERRDVLIRQHVLNLDPVQAVSDILQLQARKLQVEGLGKVLQATAYRHNGNVLIDIVTARGLLRDPKFRREYQAIPAGGAKTVIEWNRNLLHSAEEGIVTAEGQMFHAVEVLTEAAQKFDVGQKYQGKVIFLPRQALAELRAHVTDPLIEGKSKAEIAFWRIARAANAATSTALLATNPSWLGAQFVAEALPGMIMNPYRMVRGAIDWHKRSPAQKLAISTVTGAGISPLTVGKVMRPGKEYQSITMFQRFMQAVRETSLGNLLIDKRGPLVWADRMKGGYLSNVTFMANVDRAAARGGVLHKFFTWWRKHDEFMRGMPLGRGKHQERINYLLENGRFLETEAERLIDFMGNWNTFTIAGRKAAALVLFYPFVRYSLRFTFYGLPKESPMRAALLLQLGSVNKAELEDLWGGEQGFLSSYMQAAINKDPANPDNVPFMLNLARISPIGNTALDAVVGSLNLSSKKTILSGLVGLSPLGPQAYTLVTGKDAFTDQTIMPPGWVFVNGVPTSNDGKGRTQTSMSERMRAVEYQLLRLNPALSAIALGTAPRNIAGVEKGTPAADAIYRADPGRESVRKQVTQIQRKRAISKFYDFWTPAVPIQLQRYYIKTQQVTTESLILGAKISVLSNKGDSITEGEKDQRKVLYAKQKALWEAYGKHIEAFAKQLPALLKEQKLQNTFDPAAVVKNAQPATGSTGLGFPGFGGFRK